MKRLRTASLPALALAGAAIACNALVGAPDGRLNPDSGATREPDAGAAAEPLWLGTDLPLACAVVGYGRVLVDARLIDEHATAPGFVIGGEAFPRGIFAHADSDVTFVLGKAYERLHICAGIPDDAQRC